MSKLDELINQRQKVSQKVALVLSDIFTQNQNVAEKGWFRVFFSAHNYHYAVTDPERIALFQAAIQAELDALQAELAELDAKLEAINTLLEG